MPSDSNGLLDEMLEPRASGKPVSGSGGHWSALSGAGCCYKARSQQAQRELAPVRHEWDQAQRQSPNLAQHSGKPGSVIPDMPGFNLCPDPGASWKRRGDRDGSHRLACNPSPPEIPARTQRYRRPPAAGFGARSSRDIVHVELVPPGTGKEVQAASAADHQSAWRERLPIGEHDPVFTSRLGTIRTEFGQGEPVMIGAVAAEQRDTVARHR